MIEIVDKSKCCGCTACANTCPKNCIRMKPDFEGFLYPEVNKNRCINCGLCEKSCPILRQVEIPVEIPVSYAVQNKNEEVLKMSTSGGFFEVLCNYTIQKGGYIVGVSFDEQFRTVHRIVNTIEESKAFMGSKYVQSDLTDTFSKIKALLSKGKLVTFSGTPCQVAGLKSCLKKDYSNLITVDFVCRSIPSPKFWNKYLEYQKECYHSEIKSIQCRCKTYGYHNGSLIIEFTNGKRYSGSNRVDLYSKAFHQDICSRPSCYDCHFKTINRCSDFTMFDCWHPENLAEGLVDNNRGYTNVFIHSEKGKELFELELEDKIIYYCTNAIETLKFTGGMVETSIVFSEQRKNFYHTLEDRNFLEAVCTNVRVSLKDKAIENIKPILFSIGIIKLFKRK